MTASLYRRLVDLPPGLLPLWPHERTTDDVIALGVEPLDLAESIRDMAKARDLRVFVAVLSDAQASDLGTPALARPGATERLLRRLDRDAESTRLRQDVRDYAATLRPVCAPAVVACLWDGRILADVRHHSRSRRDRRFTLDDDVLDWIETEAQRRGVSQSAVVQDALRDGMAAAELGGFEADDG